jgi:hypothetical protein
LIFAQKKSFTLISAQDVNSEAKFEDIPVRLAGLRSGIWLSVLFSSGIDPRQNKKRLPPD